MSAKNVNTTLVQEAIGGDPIAMQALLHRHRKRVKEYIYRNLPPELQSHIEPVDVLQDTFVEACRRIKEFSPEGHDSVVHWLMTIARHRMIDLLRLHKAKRGKQREIEQMAEDAAEQEPQVEWDPAADEVEVSEVVELVETLALYYRTPSKSAAAHELAAALDRSIDCLPDEQGRAIRLRHVERLSAKEAAKRMNCTEGVFYRLCNRGLRRLRFVMRSQSIYV